MGREGDGVKYSGELLQKKLIEACNTLCHFIGEKLPASWEIRLSMYQGESTIALIDPSGKEIETDSPDWGVSTVSELVDVANEIQNERFLNVPYLFWSCPDCDRPVIKWSNVNGQDVATCQTCGKTSLLQEQNNQTPSS